MQIKGSACLSLPVEIRRGLRPGLRFRLERGGNGFPGRAGMANPRLYGCRLNNEGGKL